MLLVYSASASEYMFTTMLIMRDTYMGKSVGKKKKYPMSSKL